MNFNKCLLEFCFLFEHDVARGEEGVVNVRHFGAVQQHNLTGKNARTIDCFERVAFFPLRVENAIFFVNQVREVRWAAVSRISYPVLSVLTWFTKFQKFKSFKILKV